MLSKLSDLVDNLSRIFNMKCKKYMERKKIKSECDFIGFKNNRFNYRCKECRRICPKPINEAVKKFFNGDLNKFVLLFKKVFILMNIWIAGKNLLKPQYRIKKLFTAN